AGGAENVAVGSYDCPLVLRDADIVLCVPDGHRIPPGPRCDPPEQAIAPDEARTREPLRVRALRSLLTGTRHGRPAVTTSARRRPHGGGGRASPRAGTSPARTLHPHPARRRVVPARAESPPARPARPWRRTPVASLGPPARRARQAAP